MRLLFVLGHPCMKRTYLFHFHQPIFLLDGNEHLHNKVLPSYYHHNICLFQLAICGTFYTNFFCPRFNRVQWRKEVKRTIMLLHFSSCLHIYFQCDAHGLWQHPGCPSYNLAHWSNFFEYTIILNRDSIYSEA